jgi:Tfp pilus assembly protein FimT
MVELVVTMVIIGIMAIAIVPRMSLLQGFDEVGFRDQVKGALQYARKSAVAGRRDVRVTIASNAVSLERQNATPEGEGTAGFAPLLLPGRNDNQIVAPTGIALTPATITFSPLGRSSGGSVSVPGGGTITVAAETGYVY